MVFLRKVDIDIDAPRIRDFVQANTEVFKLAMNGLVEASQMPDATKEENIGLLLRGAAAYASGICKTFGIPPEKFADLMHVFDEVKIAVPEHQRVRFPKKGKPS